MGDVNMEPNNRMEEFNMEPNNRMGDFNIEQNNRMFKSFLDSTNLTNLIKTNTCFKGKGLSIKYSRNIHLSTHHHMKRDSVMIII